MVSPKEFAMAYCYECAKERPAGHPVAFSPEHLAEASRRRLAKLAATPYSRAITIMCRQPAPAPTRRPMSLTPAQQEARAAVLADRTPKERAETALRAGRAAMAITPPASRTLWLREAEAVMSRERTADATRKLLDREEDEMQMRAKGLGSHHP
jgi:hypothetical protein